MTAGCRTAANRSLIIPALILASFVIAACGSDGDNGTNSTVPTTEPAATATGASGSTGKPGTDGGQEMTPDDKAPQSAGDKREPAPDDVISDRPGGPATPVNP